MVSPDPAPYGIFPPRKSDPCEPRLGDMLADPVIQAVMLADHVDPQALRSSLMQMAGQMSPVWSREPAPSDCGCAAS